MDSRNMTWLGRTISVSDSTDPTLVGRTGLVVDESKRTITVQRGDRKSILPKDIITFSIDSGVDIIGSSIVQRPVDRIHRRYRK